MAKRPRSPHPRPHSPRGNPASTDGEGRRRPLPTGGREGAGEGRGEGPRAGRPRPGKKPPQTKPPQPKPPSKPPQTKPPSKPPQTKPPQPKPPQTKPPQPKPPTTKPPQTKPPSPSYTPEQQAFSTLSADVPLLMLPVRLETRFDLDASPPRLKIRIFPDQLFIDEHDERLTVSEVRAGREYWEAVGLHRGDDQARSRAWSWLASQTGAHRAPWVAHQTREEISPGDLRDGVDVRPSRAPLLPDVWLAVGYVGEARVLEASSLAVDPELAFSPDFSRLTPKLGDLGVDPGVAWLFDFDEAHAKGMAIDAKLSEAAADGLDTLFVVGIRSEDPRTPGEKLTPRDAAVGFEKLLRAQLYTRGAGFVPQGMPTNNTEELESAWSAFAPDLEGIWARELGEGKGSPAGLVPAPRTFRGALAPVGALPENLEEDDKNYRAFERALGLRREGAARRFENREGYERRAMASMNVLLWELTWGEVVNVMLAVDGQPYLKKADRDWLRNWFVDRVVGGAPLPAIRLGETPYGILPVQSHSHTAPEPRRRKELWAVLERFRTRYEQNIEGGRLAGTDSEANPGERLLELLSQQPHPVRFRTESLHFDEGWITFWYELVRATFTDSEDGALVDDYVEVDFRALERRVFANMAKQHGAYSDIRDQIADELQQHKDAIAAERRAGRPVPANLLETRDALKAMLIQADNMLELLSDHQIRTQALDYFDPPRDLLKGTVESEQIDPNAVFTRYRAEAPHDWPEDRHVIVPAGDATVFPDHYLDYLWQRAESFIDPQLELEASPFEGADEPLLFRLLWTSLGRVGTDPESADSEREERLREMQSALEVLKAMPWDQLELVMRQTLGLAGWRLDAWHTSFALDRLESLRETAPAGIQLGAYGWVEHLRPRETAGLAAGLSQGFVHTPSLNHAKTAAILRAGWTAYGDEEHTSTLAVDLRSGRVRTAKWLFDAVRQGQDLGDALGYLFERWLRDAKREDWIAPVRAAVLEHTGERVDPQSPSVDGLELLALWQEEDGETTLKNLTEGHFSGKAPSIAEIRPGLTLIDEAVDAMADTAVADSVHALAQGNLVRAGSSLRAISTGDAPPPELQVVDTQRRGRTVTHRVMLLVPAGDPSPGWLGESYEISPRALADPDVEHLAASVLGRSADLRFDVAYRDDKGGVHLPRVLSVGALAAADLTCGLGALDLLAMLDGDDRRPAGTLERWLCAVLDRYRPAAADPRWQPVVLDEEAAAGAIETGRTRLLLQSWRDALQPSRAVRLEDFVYEQDDEETDAGEVQVEELEKRAEALRAGLENLLRRVEDVLPEPVEGGEARPVGAADTATLRALLMDLARYHLPHAIPRWVPETERHAALYGQLWAAWSAAAKRSKAAGAVTLDAGLDVRSRLENAHTVLRSILGKATFAAVPLRPARATEVAAGFAAGKKLLDDPLAPHEWLEKMAYVKPALRRLSEALLVHDAMERPSGGCGLKVGQWPIVAGEPWAALSLPAADGRDRLSILAAIPAGLKITRSGLENGYLAGLVVDEIVERIPAPEEDTGVTLHFDAPASEAPQTMLLAVTPPEKTWDFDLVIDTLRDTLAWSRLRAIDAEHLLDFHHHLPAVFAGKNTLSGLEDEDG